MFGKKRKLNVIAATKVKREPEYTIEIPPAGQNREWIILDAHTNEWIEKCKTCKNYEGGSLNGEDGQYSFICKKNVVPLPRPYNYFCPLDEKR